MEKLKTPQALLEDHPVFLRPGRGDRFRRQAPLARRLRLPVVHASSNPHRHGDRELRQALGARSKQTRPTSAARVSTCTRPARPSTAAGSCSWRCHGPGDAGARGQGCGEGGPEHQAANYPKRGPTDGCCWLRDLHGQASVHTGLEGENDHQVIDHLKAYVDGKISTNQIEKLLGALKRSLKGTYISVDPKHLDAYVAEQVCSPQLSPRLGRVEGKRLIYTGPSWEGLVGSILSSRQTRRNLGARNS